ISFKVVEEQNQRQPSKLQLGNVKRGNALCLSCNNVIKNKVIVKDISSRKLEIPLCLLQYNHQTKQKEYIIFDEINTKFFNLDYDELIDYNAIPNFQMPNKIVPAARYLDTWDQLMNPRQRFFFSKFTSVSHEIIEELGLKWGDEWKPVLAIYTALVMGKMIDFNSRSTSWAAKEGIRNSLAFRRPSMCWDHTEINPFSKHGSGNLKTTTRYILKGIETAITHLKDTPGSFQLLNTSIMKPPKLEKEIDIIVTDPPYADDVQYSELSEFFYSWEQFILIPYFSSLVHGNTPRDHDISSNNIDRTIEFAEMGFELSMKNIYNILSPNGKLSLFYAHSSFSVWSFVIKSLINSKFRIVSTFPVHTESKDNVIALGKASIMTSTLISASKREGVKIAFFEDIQDDLRSQASENIKKYFDIGFRGTDLSMAALGSTLKILSNYSAIKTISGNIEIQDILKISRDLLTEVILGEIPNVDNITKCYLFSRILGQTQMEFKDLSILMNSLHLSLEEIRNSEIFKEQIIAKQKIYCISDYLTRDICQNYVIDQIHEGFRQFEHQGINGFWLNIRANKEVIKQVLHIILLGIDNGKLKPIRDSDSIKAEQILETIMN
ncbi:MAG: hypothetical protein OEZ01_14730, partial [Candidatus Heimdallarchaeota archaeon]|nr:hypothetical protein [Candidatus Heimdallarchaeota archaeon]